VLAGPDRPLAAWTELSHQSIGSCKKYVQYLFGAASGAKYTPQQVAGEATIPKSEKQ
jgi:hypothetical protein